MSIEEANKASVRRLREEAFNEGNLAIIDELIPDNHVFHGGEGHELIGPEPVKKLVTSLRTLFSEFHVTIDDMIADGNKVAHQFTFTGTHTGEFEGIAPTGNKVKMRAAVFNRFENGKVVETWEYEDRLALSQQLGIIPPSQ